ncbi:MAG TPA: UvrD-helicase domain-containing protein [Longimicrobiaceae bacterium]|nr:UvrD-helicase domain-containing protein [Longimicrobiaceae bacterium]
MPPVPHYLRALNPEQQAAALASEGPVLVLAGAGSGKTRTLVYRVAHLLNLGVEARRILAVTFTNRAAAEMRERVATVVGSRAKGVVLSTFHSLGARILREHGTRIGLPEKFSIYDTGDQTALVKRILEEEVHLSATAGDDRFDARRILHRISGWKNRLVTPLEAAREVAEGRTRGNRADAYEVLTADVYPRYEEALRAAGACDFDDLLLLPVQLLREDAETREALWKRWHYLMVDEYQDTNGAQLEMARLLAGPRKNLCVVGDDDQSIYAWRGADHRNILDFEHHYPGARIVLLEENYRSTQRILDAANGVIAHNPARRPKRLRTANGPGPRIDYWEFRGAPGKPAEEEEAEMVAREIGLRRFTEKLQWTDFGVLYRTNLQSRPLEEALRAANIPYRVVGGASYFDRAEIANAVAYLRVVLNPRDEVALRRIINYPARGIGRTSLFKLIETARRRGAPLWEALRSAGGDDGLSRAQAEAVRYFVETIEEARTEHRATEAAIHAGEPGERTLEGWARDFLRRVRLEEAIRADHKAEKVAEIRIDNLRDFVSAIGRYESRAWAEQPLPDEEADWSPPTLAAFLERVSLTEDGDDSRKEKEEEEPNRVTLMTLHGAKGLEFTHVFLVGLEEEILPHARSVDAVVDETGGGGPDPIAEERRLFYVGITRARHRLTLSGCATRGGRPVRDDENGGRPRSPREPVPRQPSRFLREVPRELLEIRSPGATSSLSEEDREDLKQSFFSRMRELLAGSG